MLHHRAGGGVTIDGTFAAQTAKRVRDLQTFFGSKASGQVIAETWAVVDSLA